MDDKCVRDVFQTVMPSLTEAQTAEWLREQGHSVFHHHGRHWIQTVRGFYEPLHWLAQFKANEAIRPTWACWGFRATLHDDDAEKANGFMPVYLLSDVRDYTIERLPRKRRTHLRKCRKGVQIVQVVDPQILMPEAYEVTVSAAIRIGIAPPPDREKFLKSLAFGVLDARRICLAGFSGETLLGYMSGYAIDGTAYTEWVKIATEHLPTAVGTGLAFDFVQVCANSPGVRRIVYGQHSLEIPELSEFKEGMLFAITNIPSRVWIAPILKSYIRRRMPYKYYRLTGVAPR
jgi:hypothetical protein